MIKLKTITILIWLGGALISVGICEKSKFEDKLKCYRCSSTISSSCATLVNQNTWIEEECVEGVQCAVWIQNGDTLRGCAPATPPALIATCNENLCNTFEFPEDRKRCNQCSGGTDCVFGPGQQPPPPSICQRYREDDQCYVVVESQTVAYRGCESDPTSLVGKQRCAASEFCIIGDTNAQPGFLRPSLSCVRCNQNNDPECVRRTDLKLCSTNILLGRPQDQCFTSNEGTFVRDCLLASSNFCESHDCDICNGNGCNTNIYSLRRCYFCSPSDPNCAKNPEVTRIENCITRDENESENVCFRLEDEEGRVERGCFIDLTPQEKEECSQQTATCKTCNEDECNKKVDFQQCYTCNSKIDPNCVTLERSLSYLSCQNYLDQCGVAIDSDGSTVRSCTESLPQTDLKEICEVNRCNDQVYPTNRLSCHQCHDTEECSLEQTDESDTKALCLYYQPGDMCYESIDDNFRAHRGCLSDPDAQCGKFCNRCITPNCNKNPSLGPPTLSCITCTESEPWCRWGFDASKAERCKNPIPIGTTEYCFLRVHKNKVAQRGCSNDVENYCDGFDVDYCSDCDTTACNWQNSVQQSCVDCDSKEDSNCVILNGAPEVKTCTLPGREFLPYENRGCYTLRDDEGYVRRGCIADLDLPWMERCEEGNRCELCYDQSCNTKAAPNKAGLLISSITMISISIFVLIIR